jgi:hypothetical protein
MLQFGVNVVVYALTQALNRPERLVVTWDNPVYGLTKEQQPVWEPATTTIDSTAIPASVAFLRGGETSEVDAVWTVVFDGRMVDMSQQGRMYDGMVVLGVPPGRAYTVTIWCGGKERTLIVTPSPGKVTTLRFAMERIFSIRRLGVQREKREEGYSVWKKQYREKRIVEILWEEDYRKITPL